MTDNVNAASADASSGDEKKRHRSEIEFPYSDLESAVELAATIHTKAGSLAEIDELAAWMGQTATGGTFRTRTGAARMFGLIETGQGKATLTQLGRETLDGTGNERTARVTAFLNAELFRAMYDQFKGNALPPAAAIERQMLQLGVSPKQTERARQTFMKSATYAGFIDASTGRFVKPGIVHGPERPAEKLPEKKRGGAGGDGTGLDLDPLLIELLKKIPPTDKPWPAPQRLRWFKTFAMNVSQIYDTDETPVEFQIGEP